MPEISTYLKRLRFDKKLSNTFVARYMANPRLVSLLVGLIIIAGVYSFITLPRVLNPTINIPIVIISTVLPGASPADIESLITIPLEDAVTGLANIDTLSSSSNNSVSLITIQFTSGVDPDKALQNVQTAVNTVTTLPTSAQTPSVNKIDFENQPVWTFALSTRGDPGSLIEFSQRLKQNLKDLTSVKEVDTTGLEEQEFQIDLKPEAIASYGLNPLAVSNALKTVVSSYPAGYVNTSSSSFTLNIDQLATNIEDLRSTRIQVGSTNVAIGDIALVSQRSKPDQSQGFIATPDSQTEHAVVFRVFRNTNVNIDQSVKDIQAEVNQDIAPYKNQFRVISELNTANEVDTQFSELIKDFWYTVILIFITLFVFLGLRQAVVASLATPLSFLITFIVMMATGITFSFISLFSLLLALGLLIDDTIVIVSAMTSYYRTGKFTPLETALLVWEDFLVAVLTTTMTTVWAFLPLLIASGIIGEFIKPIPIVVSTALAASLIVALLITMPFIVIILKPQAPRRVQLLLAVTGLVVLIGGFVLLVPKSPLLPLEIIIFLLFLAVGYFVRRTLIRKGKDLFDWACKCQKFVRKVPEFISHGIISFDILSSKYKQLITKILATKANRRKAMFMVIAFSLFSYILVPLGLVQNEFFPLTDQDYIYVNLEYPTGTNLQTTLADSLALFPKLQKTTQLAYVTLDLGRNFSGGFGTSTGNNLAQFTLNLTPHQNRRLASFDIAQDLRKQFADYNKGKLSVLEVSSGPPAGADVQLNIFGDDLTVLDNLANKTITYLQTVPGAANVDKSIKAGTSKIAFTPDKAKLADAGLTVDTLGFWLRLFASGFNVQTVKFTNISQDITIRMGTTTQTPEDIGKLMIPTQNGNLALSSLGSLVLETNPTVITRQGGKRTISVTASVAKGYNLTNINRQLINYANSKLDLPAGYSFQTGGANEENQKSVTSILEAMILSFVLILITMVITFNSFRRALIVLLVIPLSVSGVFVIFALTHTPLSFPALIGVLALFGIVVKNAILIVDKIIINRDSGMEFVDAITDGAASRLEPIALTSFAAILGLVPISLSNALWRGLGGAIISGLTFSGTIMLLFIPVIYYSWMKD